MKKSPLDIARERARTLSGQLVAGIQRGKIIGDRNVYFTDEEVEEMAASAAELVLYLNNAKE